MVLHKDAFLQQLKSDLDLIMDGRYAEYECY